MLKSGRLYSASVAKTLYLVIVSTCPSKLTEEPFNGESGRGKRESYDLDVNLEDNRNNYLM